MRVVAIIPARLESTRLPRKLLLAETGKPLIVHTFEAVLECTAIEDVIVATDSSSIADLFGDRAVMTGEHQSGTDRIWEAVLTRVHPKDDVLAVNIQADEPQISVASLEALIAAATSIPGCDMATLATSLGDGDQENPNVVKVRVGEDGIATAFKRQSMFGVPMRHIGAYAYSARFLEWYAAQPQSENEKRESLEQLRALDAGCRIRVAVVEHDGHGIDTREDYDRFIVAIATSPV